MILPTGSSTGSCTQVLQANLDGADHPEPLVEKTFLRFAAAKAREEAVRQADLGDFDGAARSLHLACESMMPYADHDAVLQEEVADLGREAARLTERRYTAADRKYNQARSSSAREMKEAYIRKLSRQQPPEPKQP